jgi:hypothetical protein
MVIARNMRVLRRHGVFSAIVAGIISRAAYNGREIRQTAKDPLAGEP